MDLCNLNAIDVKVCCEQLLDLAQEHYWSVTDHMKMCRELKKNQMHLSAKDVCFIVVELEKATRLHRRLLDLCERIAAAAFNTQLSTLQKAGRLLNFKEILADMNEHFSVLRLNKVKEVGRRLERVHRINLFLLRP